MLGAVEHVEEGGKTGFCEHIGVGDHCLLEAASSNGSAHRESGSLNLCPDV